jgi:choline transport protein
MLVSLINIGSTQAFEAFIGILIAAYFSSFLLAAAVMLHKRLTTPESELPWGPFRLKKFGVPLTIIAMAYTGLGLFWSFWPYTPEVSAENMNYSVLLFGGALIFAMIFWAFWGRKVYVGPILEFSGHAMGAV